MDGTVVQVHFKVSKMVQRPMGFEQPIAKITWLGPVAHVNKVLRGLSAAHVLAVLPLAVISVV